MQARSSGIVLAAIGLMALFSPGAIAQDDVADVPSKDIRIGENDKKQYFLTGPAKGAKASKSGFKLLLVMPGGDGSAEFNPFVRRIWKNAMPEGYLVAQLVAPKWTEEQAKRVVWPTVKSKVPEAKFDTETFIAEVVADVRTHHKIDDKHIYALAWSSSGPAVHAAMLKKGTPLKGAFIAMSVFRPADLPDLAAAKGRPYYLYQSRGDKITTFSFAEAARDKLTEAGAKVKLVEYDGGHGWKGDVFGSIRRGIEWLESPGKGDDAKPALAKKKPAKGQGDKPDSKGSKGNQAGGKNLLENGDFEKHLRGWDILNNSGRMNAERSDSAAHSGTQSLAIRKIGGMPMDVVRCDIDTLPAGKTVVVSAMVKTKGVKNTFFKFFVYDSAGESLVDDVDVKRLTGTADWTRIEKTFELPANAASGAVMIAVVLEGEIWVDDVSVIEK